ncbi:Chromosome partition protein smc [hydrothermal vent metagenome]|uniref:Chromosome partition protein smc n=1 Tax=hydrothermal vent metagenome TaxID=652676 RepID=A0A3B0WAG7_9ZZZZ
MQLSKLEIKGFKSFGDKAIINFDKGITGIVGPNGCGKSNIVDAIRWVLGEQKTKTLRSDKMENIIFNGTKKRKPTQMAEVSLTFNNTKNILPTEYSQVTITRRYYRSSESEYELNGVPCRLKDITNLFLDTGISSNSYAIIELKMVDDILSDKDNSRRHLFEEAAGISKFKKRKKETLRKLEGTDADLERVEDLLFEIEKNLKSLEKQARQAERYFILKETYKEKSLLLASESIKTQTEALNSLNKQIEQESDKKLNFSKYIAEKEAAIAKLKKDLVVKEKLLSSRQKSLNEHVNNIRQYESDKKIENERLRFLNDKEENIRSQIDLDKKSNERSAFSIKSLNTEFESVQKQFAELELLLEQINIDKEEQQSITQKAKEESEAFEIVHQSNTENLYQVKKSIEINEIKLVTLKQQLEKTASASTAKTANLAEFDNRILSLSKELNIKTTALKKLETDEKRHENQITQTNNTISVIKDQSADINRKLDAKQNEYNLTKSLVDNLEGFPEAIKFLKKTNDWDVEAPLLSDLITCSEEYRVSIENYLEPYLNYYVVDSYDQAHKAINLLSNASKGKANFFILEAFKGFTPTKGHLIENAFPASEIMEFDSKYKLLISYMLDNVYMVNSEDQPFPDIKEAIFITKSGKLIKRPLSLSGGSVGLFEGKKIGRAKNLENLSREIKKLDTQLTVVNTELGDTQTELDKLMQSTLKELIRTKSEELKLVNDEYIALTTKQEQFTSLISQTDVDKEELLTQMELISEQKEELMPKSEFLAIEIEESKNNLFDIKSLFESHNAELAEKNKAYNDNNIKFHQFQNKLNSLEQEISFKKTTFEASKQRIDKNEQDLKVNDKEIKSLLSNSESYDVKLLDLYEEKETIENGVNEAEKEYYNQRGGIDKTESEHKGIQNQRENIDGFILELTNALNDKKLELSSIKERLKVEFEVDLNDIIKESGKTDKDLDGDQLSEEVQALKDKIERIGSINPMALEAYDEIKERYNFISGQKEDLETAKESLISTISEIDLVAKATFLDAFSKIEKNFIKVFRSLFTEEDQCDLKLTDPSNPLESAIEIIAKPKGKKPLSINQLSGGEKTLTATSLLFAIYLLKPAPFCIFDEVDAPLDDANIDKFNKIIREFSSESQFIIVTHNKRTMTSTDIIYGITMIEQGVSRVIPVDIRELN